MALTKPGPVVYIDGVQRACDSVQYRDVDPFRTAPEHTRYLVDMAQGHRIITFHAGREYREGDDSTLVFRFFTRPR